jgi:signal transduction histidine kinase
MRRRILLATVSVAAVAVFLFAIPLAVAVSHLYRAEQVIELERQATAAAAQVPTSFASSRDPVDLPAVKASEQVALYGADGRLVVGQGPSHADTVVLGALKGRVVDATEGARIVVATPLSTREQVVGAVRASIPQSTVAARTHRTWLGMALLGLIVVIVSGLLARALAERIARPIRWLASAARDLGQGDFTVRVKPSGIDELDRVGEALGITGARLQRVLERERSFSADASHQMLTPISALRLSLESARATPDADPYVAIDQAILQCDRLESTVDSLLLLARDQEHSGRLEMTRLSEWLDHEWKGRLSAQGRLLQVRVAPDAPRAGVSFEAARHVVDVLMDNACCHGNGAVTVGIRGVARAVVIDVADEGQGISGDPEAIFRRRVTKGPGPGHGIGLALARSLAEADGGRLTVKQAGAHPVFSVIWPAAGDPAPQSETASATESA